MKRFQGLDSLMSANGITDSASFTAYWKEVIDKRQSQTENLVGFEWDTAQIEFNYKMLIEQDKVDVMASYVDLNSPAMPAGKQVDLKILEGWIPRMKYAVALGENDYRKQLTMLNEVRAKAVFANKSEQQSVQQYLANRLFETLSEVGTAFKESLNYQVGQFKSTAQLSLDDKTNPRGAIRTTIKSQVPETNFMSKKWWSKKADGTVVAVGDPIGDLRDFIRELAWKANGYDNVTVEMSEKFFYKLMSHTAVLKEIGYASPGGFNLRHTKDNDANAIAVARGMMLEAQKGLFKAVIGAGELITSKTQCGVEKLNAKTKKYERTLLPAFEEEVVLIRPAGRIGVIKNVVPFRPDGQAIVGDIYGGRGIIEYVYNRDTREQRWQGELTALAVLTRPYDMYYFKNLTQEEESAQPASLPTSDLKPE